MTACGNPNEESMPCPLHVVRLARQEHVSAATRQIAQLELCFSSLRGEIKGEPREMGNREKRAFAGKGLSHIGNIFQKVEQIHFLYPDH